MYEIGFIGAGNMAEAIARAAIGKNVLSAAQMTAADPSEARRDVFSTLGVVTDNDNVRVITQSKVLMLAIKPQMLASIADELGQHLRQDQIIVSIMAGITVKKLIETIGKPVRVVRVMPNTPLMIGQGMAGIALGAGAQAGDESLAVKLFSAAGQAIMVEESQIDAITAVSGSGPAYIFYLAEAMEKAASELGLKQHARLLVQQTIFGAAQLLAQSTDTPAELRRKVTSPGGTTEAAIKHMDGNKSIDVIVNAIKAAEKRSRELGA